MPKKLNIKLKSHFLFSPHEVYQRKYFQGSSHFQIAQWLKRRKVKSILDLGCGGGFLLGALGDGWKGDIVGVDFDKAWQQEVEITKYKKVYWVDLNSAEIKKIAKSNKFDAVVAADILEHLSQPEKLLHQIPEILTKDGVLIVSLPNNHFFPVRILHHIMPNFRMRRGPLDFTHLHFFNQWSAKSLIERHFKIVDFQSTPFPLPLFGKIFNRNEVLFFFYLAFIKLNKMLPWHCGYQFLIVAKAKKN